MDGVMHAGHIMINIQQDFSDCKELAPKMIQIATWASVFKNPTTAFPQIWSNILANFVKILHYIDVFNQSQAVSAYIKMGDAAARVLQLIIGPVVIHADIDGLNLTQFWVNR